VARYGGKKVERARDLFRQAIDEAPPQECKPLFLAYAKYEEEHGLARNAMQVGRLNATYCFVSGQHPGDGRQLSFVHATDLHTCPSGCLHNLGVQQPYMYKQMPSPLRRPCPAAFALQVYEQAVRKVPDRERLSLYEVYVTRALEFFGVGKVSRRSTGSRVARPWLVGRGAWGHICQLPTCCPCNHPVYSTAVSAFMPC
jgi:hypothetical protein